MKDKFSVILITLKSWKDLVNLKSFAPKTHKHLLKFPYEMVIPNKSERAGVSKKVRRNSKTKENRGERKMKRNTVEVLPKVPFLPPVYSGQRVEHHNTPRPLALVVSYF